MKGCRPFKLVVATLILALVGTLGCNLLPIPGGEPQIQFAAREDVIESGECTYLEWEVEGAEDYTVFLDGEKVRASGVESVCPRETTIYELVVAAPGGPHEGRVVVQVKSGPGPAPTSEPPPPAATTAPAPAAATATPRPPAPPAATATPPPPAPPATTPTHSPTATPTRSPTPTPTTFVPVWGQCTWVTVHPTINSHQPVTWCPNGYFLTGLDLDREGSYDAMDSPVVGQAHCCPLSVAQFSPWGQCSWEPVEKAGKNSHQALVYCPNGQYLTGLDLDRIATDAMDSPGVGQGFCCPFGDPNKYLTWASCSWEKVEQAGINSHQRATWCPNGSFLAGLDLDREGSYDPLDSPVVGQAYCCTPQ